MMQISLDKVGLDKLDQLTKAILELVAAIKASKLAYDPVDYGPN